MSSPSEPESAGSPPPPRPVPDAERAEAAEAAAPAGGAGAAVAAGGAAASGEAAASGGKTEAGGTAEAGAETPKTPKAPGAPQPGPTPQPAPQPWPQPGPPPQPGPYAQPAPAPGLAYRPPGSPYRPPLPPPEPAWVTATEPKRPALPHPRVLAAAGACGVVSALFLGDGLGVNLLLVAVVAAVGAGLAAAAVGRKVRPWTAVWAAGAMLLLAVPALYEAGWPVFLAMVGAVATGSLALHGGRRWPGVLLGPIGLWEHLIPGVAWSLLALRGQGMPARAKVMPILRAVGVTAVLLVIFGALFAGADSTVADLFDDLMPDLEAGNLPYRFVMFFFGLTMALAAAHAAAAPRRWDRLPVKPGTPRGRLEWALPMIAMNLLFGGFVVVQLVVLIGGRGQIMARTGLTPAEYARQGFWQLLWVIVLTMVVVAVARRWAPRANDGDRLLVRILLTLLCTLTLVVAVAALYRMQLYMDAFGLTRLRISVAAVEIWLGVVFVLVIAGGVVTAQRWLPRAVVLSAVVAVAVFGLISPDALIAEQNVARYERTGTIDVGYLRGLSADAVPALDRLPADQRTCALQVISAETAGAGEPLPWYAMSLSESRARDILTARPAGPDRGAACHKAGFREYGDGY
ncbi:DUF4153 domain-containing protein [Kitasatospora camelliae]|uniref:DUF4173 domain-containing protein n=1 Tax=Kitasatospora camelliae TaxID=3156397 RepID=A0AAU8JZ32_9ACTN